MLQKGRLYLSLIVFLLLMTMTVATATGCERTETPTDTIVADTTAEESTMNDETIHASTAEETTAAETTAEETSAAETETEESSAAETDIPEAGLQSGVIRDGTPKKYFTIRFDDGITQDARIIELLKKYDMDCCTFYVNSGLLGANWEWVGQAFGKPEVTHQRYTKEELLSGIYDGFDVEAHTLTHPSLKNLSPRRVTREVQRDVDQLTEITGFTPVGVAWPGGDTEWNEQNLQTVLETTSVRYGVCTTYTSSFALPTYFMTWYPTCGFHEANALELTQRFIEAEPTEDMLFFIWGHGYEFDIFNSWDRLETVLKMISEAAAADDSIVLVTNAEFYQLFKDEIPSWKK